jgi:RNA polymerase sigma-70 factor (subfamily 1)
MAIARLERGDGNRLMQLASEDNRNRWNALIDRARSGCDIALGEIFESVHSYLTLVAESRIGSRVRSKFGASDVIQRSMLEAQDSIEDFRGTSKVEFRLWLKRIVINNLTDEARRYTHTRSRCIEREVSGDELASQTCHSHLETPSWHLRRREFDRQLWHAVSKLPNRQRYVIEARHRHGCDYSEIASQLEISEAGARKLWSRAAQQLRSVLEQPQ